MEGFIEVKERTKIFQCTICGALVSEQAINDHVEWHRRLSEFRDDVVEVQKVYGETINRVYGEIQESKEKEPPA